MTGREIIPDLSVLEAATELAAIAAETAIEVDAFAVVPMIHETVTLFAEIEMAWGLFTYGRGVADGAADLYHDITQLLAPGRWGR